MFTAISEFSGLAGQFAGTLFLAALLTGVILLAYRLLPDTDVYWFYGAAIVVLFLLIVFPHGWSMIFSDNAPDWEALRERRVMISHASLFKADFWGVIIGAGAAFIASLFFSGRRGW